jgi:Anti-sigma-K factor rskA/Putative zinc-finger
VKASPGNMHVLTGSYALDALGAQERTEFERHLQHCPSCQAEVRGLRETAARLAIARSARPPAQMEQRVLAATYRTRQLPPLAGQRLRRDLRQTRLARLFAGWLAAGQSPPDASQPRRSGRDRGNGWSNRWLRSPRLVGAVAAACVAVAVGLGITQVATQHQLDSAHATSAAIAKVLDAPDARIEATPATVGGAVTVVVSALQREAVVTTSGMPSLSSSRVYQVWVMSSSGARSVGLLSSTDHIGQLLASGVQSGDQIGITVEPSGGTSRPTTTPVATVPLTT